MSEEYMTKREIVEEWLHQICCNCEAYAGMEDEYHPGEYDMEINELLRSAGGLVSRVQYEPGTEEWENFESEGYLWETPSDEQVEELYPKALEELEEWDVD